MKFKKFEDKYLIILHGYLDVCLPQRVREQYYDLAEDHSPFEIISF